MDEAFQNRAPHADDPFQRQRASFEPIQFRKKPTSGVQRYQTFIMDG